MTENMDVTDLVALTARMDQLDMAVAGLAAQNGAILTALAALTVAMAPQKPVFVAKR
jgi:hypothetical protein